MDFLQKNDLLEETSTISEQSKMHLASIAQWINIAAIVSFVSLAVSTIQLIFQSSKGSFNSSNMLGQLVVVAITLLLNITLFNAAKFLKVGLAGTDQSFFNVGIRKLNSYFKIVGILVIVLLVFFALALIIGIFAASVGGFGR